MRYNLDHISIIEMKGSKNVDSLMESYTVFFSLSLKNLMNFKYELSRGHNKLSNPSVKQLTTHG